MVTKYQTHILIRNKKQSITNEGPPKKSNPALLLTGATLFDVVLTAGPPKKSTANNKEIVTIFETFFTKKQLFT